MREQSFARGRAETADINRSLSNTIEILRESATASEEQWAKRVESLEAAIAEERRESATASARARAADERVKRLEHDLQYERFVVAVSDKHRS